MAHLRTLILEIQSFATVNRFSPAHRRMQKKR